MKHEMAFRHAQLSRRDALKLGAGAAGDEKKAAYSNHTSPHGGMLCGNPQLGEQDAF